MIKGSWGGKNRGNVRSKKYNFQRVQRPQKPPENHFHPKNRKKIFFENFENFMWGITTFFLEQNFFQFLSNFFLKNDFLGVIEVAEHEFGIIFSIGSLVFELQQKTYAQEVGPPSWLFMGQSWA